MLALIVGMVMFGPSKGYCEPFGHDRGNCGPLMVNTYNHYAGQPPALNITSDIKDPLQQRQSAYRRRDARRIVLGSILETIMSQPKILSVECQDIDNGKMCQHIANSKVILH